MILTGRDLQWYIQTGKLSITPLSAEQFQQNGLDLILGDVEAADRGALHFRLGTTRETVELPDDLMAFIGIRSTWARRGFLMAGLTVIDAGFKGQITLEILNACESIWPLGERFAHIIFARLTGPTDPYRGKYQGQHGITLAKGD